MLWCTTNFYILVRIDKFRVDKDDETDFDNKPICRLVNTSKKKTGEGKIAVSDKGIILWIDIKVNQYHQATVNN